MSVDTECALCSKTAKQICSACKLIHYCSKDCQKKHWKKHKDECKPFMVKNHDVYGRYLEATRPIKAGEIILKEAPLILGPKQISSPLCLGCLKNLQSDYTCSKCRYPLCSKQCENRAWHMIECPILSKGSSRSEVVPKENPSIAYEFITPLRCLLAATQDPKKKKSLLNLQSHVEDLKNSELYRRNQKSVIEYVENIFQYDVNEAELHRMCGILTTNSFEIEKDNSKFRGLFDVSSMIVHDCKPNTKHVFDANSNIIWIATVPITKGEPIKTTYSHILWNTLQRRLHLKVAKCFDCGCKRCSDPTELATNISTLLCSQCKTGHVTAMDPLDVNSEWCCENCGHTLRAKQIAWGDKVLYNELKDIGKNNPKLLEKFLQNYEETLHANHRYFNEAKYALIKYYGNNKEVLYKDLTQEQLENKVKWCRQLLEIAAVIDPGMSVLRGNLLFELQAALVGTAKHLFSNDIIDEEKAQEYTTEAVKYLQEANEILRQDPELAAGKLDAKLDWLSRELDL